MTRRLGAGRWRPLSEQLANRPEAADERYFHEDLRTADAETLRVERQRLRLAILLSSLSRPDPWTLERLARVVAELEARRAR
jgi:hypothetical protein